MAVTKINFEQHGAAVQMHKALVDALTATEL